MRSRDRPARARHPGHCNCRDCHPRITEGTPPRLLQAQSVIPRPTTTPASAGVLSLDRSHAPPSRSVVATMAYTNIASCLFLHRSLVRFAARLRVLWPQFCWLRVGLGRPPGLRPWCGVRGRRWEWVSVEFAWETERHMAAAVVSGRHMATGRRGRRPTQLT